MESEQDALHSKKESINAVELEAGDSGGGGGWFFIYQQVDWHATANVEGRQGVADSKLQKYPLSTSSHHTQK